MFKQMIRQKLQQNLKQQKGKVFPLPPPVTVPSCTVFCNPIASSWFHPFPGSHLCLGNMACDCRASKETVLAKSTPPHTGLLSFSHEKGMVWLAAGRAGPGKQELGKESLCPPAGRALKRVLHAHPHSADWTVEEYVGKQIPGWMNNGLNEWEMSSLLQKSLPSYLNRKANFEATLFSMARFCIYSALEYGHHLLPVYRTKKVLG